MPADLDAGKGLYRHSATLPLRITEQMPIWGGASRPNSCAGAMSEPLFHPRPQGLTVREVAALTGAELAAGVPPERRIDGIAALDHAGPSDLAFLDNPKYLGQLAGTDAGLCLVAKRFAGQIPPGLPFAIAREPYRAFVTVARALFPSALRPVPMFGGSSEGAFVHPTAHLEAGVSIDPGVVVGPGAEIGSDTIVSAGAVIGPQVRIGRNCVVGAGATVTHALVGDRVVIHPGCRIGQDGFGYLPGGKGHEKVPQVGRVIIQDDVEIGANTTIDRGASRDTVIGEGTKIDNLVQIGHNVVIGRHCVLVAQTGLSGSTTLGDFVVLGARVGSNNHVTIGDGAQIAAISIVNDDVPPGARWGGTPAKPIKQWFREMKVLERMANRDAAGAPHEGDA
jgi:UDP-3-O-[3-hydroxymyristoyl] glucosamine N-acyltransferase